jgi:hypothetical protein
MTPEQRYLLDINGFLCIPAAVEPGALRAAVRVDLLSPRHGTRLPRYHWYSAAERQAADTARCCPQQAAAYAATSADRQARSSGTQDHRWDLYSDPALAALAFTPTVWPVVLELTRNQPMIRLGIGIHDAPRSGGGGMLHCNREFQRSSALGSSSMASYST